MCQLNKIAVIVNILFSNNKWFGGNEGDISEIWVGEGELADIFGTQSWTFNKRIQSINGWRWKWKIIF